MAVLQNLPPPCVCYPKDPMWNRVNPKQTGLLADWYDQGGADSARCVISGWMVQLISNLACI